jgi:hypothetical protein
VKTNNYYLHGFVSEAWLSRWGVLCGAALLVLMLAAAARTVI